MALSARQATVVAAMLEDCGLYLTRVLALPDFSTRIQDGIDELELEDTSAVHEMLECWTTLELIASTNSERQSLKELSSTIETLRAVLKRLQNHEA